MEKDTTFTTKAIISETVNPEKLTQQEEAILILTEEIWNRFLELPVNHPMEVNEIAIKIHDIQRMIMARPGFRLNQEIFKRYGKRIDRLRADSEKRILRFSEGNRIWYQLWIDPGDMMRIEPLLEGGNRLWCIEIQKYYVFFYEVRNGRRLIGKNRIKEILDILL